MPGEHAGFHQVERNGIEAHLHRSGVALRLIDDDDPAIHRRFEFAVEPFVGRRITGTESLQYYTF